ncbi:MAG: uracil-DNA glycosylase family protein [Thiolinea sp.]
MKDQKTIKTIHAQLIRHQQALRQCSRCPDMIRPVITGYPAVADILLLGQAPGVHEAEVQRPFGWTAGKTLFQWFASIGVQEAVFREKVYMAAVCRCFPGKQANRAGKTGGDRVPNPMEIANCRPWLEQELKLLQPPLIIAVGKLAISQFIPVNKLDQVIGQLHALYLPTHSAELLPLPHPSGASTWHRMEPGKTLLQQALGKLEQHPAWQNLLNPPPAPILQG